MVNHLFLHLTVNPARPQLTFRLSRVMGHPSGHPSLVPSQTFASLELTKSFPRVRKTATQLLLRMVLELTSPSGPGRPHTCPLLLPPLGAILVAGVVLPGTVHTIGGDTSAENVPPPVLLKNHAIRYSHRDWSTPVIIDPGPWYVT